MRHYNCLTKSIFEQEPFAIVPIRYEDRFAIMKWRNEQIYHLRQNKPLTVEDQENYFKNVVENLFEKNRPDQILFSYLENEVCIGYGGLVHINWIDKNAEISFVLNSELKGEDFHKHWCVFLNLIERVAFKELHFHKIFTYAFDLRPHLYKSLEISGFHKEATLKEHCFFESSYKDVIIHAKFNKNYNQTLFLREATENDAELLFGWVNEENVRKNSIRQEPVTWDNHIKWLAKKLTSPETRLFVLCSENEALGQIRVDKKDLYWEIDYSIDYQYRGKGLGKEIVRLLIKKLDNYKLKATVKKQNKASINVFVNLGFKKIQIESDDFEYFEY